MQPSDPNYWNQGEKPVASATQPADSAKADAAQPVSDAISWEASEHLQHNNGLWWYVAFFAVVLVLIVFAILFHAWTFIPVVLVMAVTSIIYIRRPPRVLQYRLDDSGLSIDEITHPYSTYKSFSVVRDGAVFAILLIPTRRFSASTIVYFDEADGEAIVDAFGDRLPLEHRDLDTLDRFLRLIRF